MHFSELDQSTIWCIDPSALEAYKNFIAGASPETISSLEKVGKFQAESKPEPTAAGAVAIIPVVGPITKHDTIFSAIFGGTSIERLRKTLESVALDDKIKSIVLSIDSPGGTIAGVSSLADYIFELRSKKPVVAFTDGLMASAAYWIGSAAQHIVSESTASVGSIGVMTVHSDFSKADENAGLKRTFLSAGKYKVLGNDAEPLGAKGKDYFENRLNYFYSLFVDAVAKNRGVSSSVALGKMAEGRVFIGAQALKAGLIDSTGNFDDVIQLAQSAKVGTEPKIKSISTTLQKGIKTMAQNQFSTFEQAVDYFHLEKNQSKVETIQFVMKKFPDLHQDYLERANSGEAVKRI